MSDEYSEGKLLRDASVKLLTEELGWGIVDQNADARRSPRDVLLERPLRDAIRRLNPWTTDAQIDRAIETLERRLSSSSLLQINEEKYDLLRNGIPVAIPRPDGTKEIKRVGVFDFQSPEKNEFAVAPEFAVQGSYHAKRADLVGFVNGVPLLFVELKKFDKDVRFAYDGNYSDYQRTIPQLFYYNAFVMLSNGRESKIGTLGSKFEFFHEWKRLSEEDRGATTFNVMLRGVCDKANFLDLFENFILFDRSGGRTTKILARNHQFLGVNRAFQAYDERKANGGKLGVFWHTQGSGKSYSMLFFAQKIRRKRPGSPTFVILTDREELNAQIAETFVNCGLLQESQAARALPQSSEELVQLLKGNPSFVFTLIQKFNRRDLPPIVSDHDVVVISDEAHRTQYGIFAENMTRLLPNASRIGFTGTPIFADDAITERTFGAYVSKYDFQRAVEDGATVPLYYENRGERIKSLDNPAITDEILDAFDDAELDPEQIARLEGIVAQKTTLLMAEPRLRAVARDFVKHYSDLMTSGKAMFVCLSKVACVRMYDYAQEYWQEEIKTLENRLKETPREDAETLEKKIAQMRETEMAVVVSPEQNEGEKLRQWGLDIEPHRRKMATRKLDKEFKDPDNPFRVVFVCAMWLTGFDVKSLAILYLDKPMKAHSLMQAIARANRVCEGKSAGLIVDYIGIVKQLREALADYAGSSARASGEDPVIDKDVLIERVRQTLATVKTFLQDRGFALDALVDARGFDKLELIENAAESVSGSENERRSFSKCANDLKRLVRHANRDDLEERERDECEAIAAVDARLHKKNKYPDATPLRVEIDRIVAQHLKIETASEERESRRFDISAINFELLSREFARRRNKKLLIKDLEELLAQKLEGMLETNPARINFYERFQQIIEEFNAEQDRAEIEKVWMDLLEFANSLDEEERRYIREGFDSEEELALFDKLNRIDLDKEDIKQLKEVSKTLLKKIRETLAGMDHWLDKEATKSEVENLIRAELWKNLPETYPEDDIYGYAAQIFEYVCERFKEAA